MVAVSELARFLMGLHGDNMEMDEEDYDDEDMMLDEEDECHQAGEEVSVPTGGVLLLPFAS